MDSWVFRASQNETDLLVFCNENQSLSRRIKSFGRLEERDLLGGGPVTISILLTVLLQPTLSSAVDVPAMPICTAGDMAVEQCDAEFAKEKEACREIVKRALGIPKATDMAKQIRAEFKACRAKVEEKKQECDGTQKQAENACSQAKADAEAKKAREEEAARQAEQKAIDAIFHKKRAQDEITHIEAQPLPPQEKEVQTQAPRSEKEVAQKVEVKETQKRDVAIQNSQGYEAMAAMAESIQAALRQSQNRRSLDGLEIQTAGEQIEKLSDNVLQNNPDVGNNKPRPAATKPEGSPTANPGQGGKPSDQAGGGPQKKQDEAGGGGGGLPSLPSSGSGSASSPLKVSEPAQDCSNPSVASSNPVCACRLNPTDSRCSSILAADKEKGSNLAKKANIFTGESEGGGGGFNSSGGGYPSDASANKRQASQHGQLEQNAGGSVGKGVGSGQGSGSAAEGKDPKGKAQAYRDQTTGRGGSGGGGGGGSGFSAASGQPNGRIPSTFAKAQFGNQRIAGNVRSAKDLRAQMQAQFNAMRGPAGVVGPDGITGKHTDQWKKIRKRYEDILGN